jgi:4-hydroxy-tetrahydrodipicolinate synthase
MTHPFSGCGTALVTPFRADQSLDEPALRRLVRRQIDEGIHFLVPCGTTGESPTLTRAEHLGVIAVTLDEANGKVPVLAGAGGYNTREVIELARDVSALGVEGILSVTPYYNKPTQEGLYQHYRAIAEAVPLPIVVYDFAVFSGDDAVTIPLMALGGRGIISVVSNEIPGPMSCLAKFCLEGNFAEARKLQRKYLPLMEINFVESNPIPVKAALGLMGLLDPVFRLPMVPPQPHNLAKIKSVLKDLNLAS